ncbi:flavin reductase family protein [Methylopila sp. Yamaguchi]|uniref:flavin reductase family protein n=1 Tax=Methylopila sp. Yamaguchi TaxID=1437817 RepID=UPI000CCA6F2D|nr:flavin reductase family protein [Methylopila sp. Yamaguchi]GBD47108.1 flavin reductase domain-containing protein [Methylopila sp. Yamaguchi]
MSEAGEDPIDPRAFRRAAGCFATGVSIVAAKDELGRRVGVTANSFVSVSLDPPLISVALARSLSSMPAFERASHFGISVLGEEQADCAMRFASRGADKWAGTPSAAGVCGAPLIRDAIATFECARYAMHDGGDHHILIGRVLKLTSAPSRRPLLFHAGAFATLSAPSQAPAALVGA